MVRNHTEVVLIMLRTPPRLARHGPTVAVLLLGDGLFAEMLEKEDIPFFRVRSLSKWSIPGMIRLIRRGRFDLVYGNNTMGISRNALIAAKLAGVPFIFHQRSMGWKGKWRHYWFLRLAVGTNNVSISLSIPCCAGGI